MPSPVKLAHVVLQTNNIDELREWWSHVLGAKVQYENEVLCFMTYDEEHHRLALAKLGEYKPHDPETAGVHHMAFTFESLDALLTQYEELRQRGIEPWWTINHGPTLSFYYRDPDGNQVEMQVDVFATAEEGNAYFNGPNFAANPIGVDVNPDELLARHRAGEPDEELLRRPGDVPVS